MKNKMIVFTEVNKAEYLEYGDIPAIEAESVRVRTHFSTVSCGTEKANIIGDPNVAGRYASPPFPRILGYSSSGIVEEVGSSVKSVKPGDRVVVYWGKHAMYNTVHENNVVKIEDDNISFEEAAISFIATFPMAAIRKTRLEMGESMLIMGLGLLGQLAVILARASGAVPIVAVDPVAERRKQALENGADFAFDPYEPDFAKKVKEVCGGGAKTCIEVTGVGAGLDGALDCMANFGRMALLGCTRNSDFTIDYYKKVHVPGISLIGAHTRARPDRESYPGYFTHVDDIKAVLKLISGKRIDIGKLIAETHTPEECGDVYTRLVNDKNFPTVVQFDWRNVK